MRVMFKFRWNDKEFIFGFPVWFWIYFGNQWTDR